MTTLLSKAQKLIQKIRSDRHDIEDWPKDSLDAFLELEQAIAQELASQSASTNEPLRSCGSCKNFSTQSLTGGAKCVACKAFNNWEPKP